MDNNNKGRFTSNLLSLQLQLKTLLEDAGGQNAVRMLDALCSLTPTEQEIALKVFKNVLERVATREDRIFSRRDKEMRELEDNLFEHIISDLKLSEKSDRKLSLVCGGKTVTSSKREKKSESKTVSLAERRARKDEPFKPILN